LPVLVVGFVIILQQFVVAVINLQQQLAVIVHQQLVVIVLRQLVVAISLLQFAIVVVLPHEFIVVAGLHLELIVANLHLEELIAKVHLELTTVVLQRFAIVAGLPQLMLIDLLQFAIVAGHLLVIDLQYFITVAVVLQRFAITAVGLLKLIELIALLLHFIIVIVHLHEQLVVLLMILKRMILKRMILSQMIQIQMIQNQIPLSLSLILILSLHLGRLVVELLKHRHRLVYVSIGHICILGDK
jgi:hypothetical protein